MANRRGSGANTIKEALEHVADAHKRHIWPNEIEPGCEKAFSVFSKAQTVRAHADWADLDIVELARVSKLIVRADREAELAEVEGTVILGGKNMNVQVANPRLRVVSEMSSSVNSILRRLGIIGRAPSPSNTNTAERGAAQRAVAHQIKLEEDDDISLI